jgi:transposase InsO family protein
MLGRVVERSITADDLIDELDRLATQRAYPAVLRCDNGPELACAEMADWARDRVGLAFIPPGEPWRNGYVESFNSRVRDECLYINIFWSLAHARVVIADWKYQYNHHRPTPRWTTSRQPATPPPAPTNHPQRSENHDAPSDWVTPWVAKLSRRSRRNTDSC